MEDRHRFVCHRMQAAQSTNQSDRGWCFAPEEPKTPGYVWKVLAWGGVLTCLFVCTPVIVRALMQ